MSENPASPLNAMQTTMQHLDLAQAPPTPQFHSFPLLPGELRLKIWNYAICVPRLLNITCERPPFQRGITRTVQYFRSSLPPPGTLYACRESRYEALAVYKPHFKTSRSNQTYISTRRHIYISFAYDTFRFVDSLLGYMAETELQGMVNVVLEVKDTAYFGHFNMEIIKRMRSLKRVDLWADKGVTISWDARVDAWLNHLVTSIEDAKDIDPGWECPEVRIFHSDTGAMVRRFEGGAAIPGWTEPKSAFELDV